MWKQMWSTWRQWTYEPSRSFLYLCSYGRANSVNTTLQGTPAQHTRHTRLVDEDSVAQSVSVVERNPEEVEMLTPNDNTCTYLGVVDLEMVEVSLDWCHWACTAFLSSCSCCQIESTVYIVVEIIRKITPCENRVSYILSSNHCVFMYNCMIV